MRPQLIAGIVLAVLGALILFRGLTYGGGRSVVRVGEFQASVEERRPIPAWVGGLAIGGAVLLIGAGMRRRRVA